ncbi:MAG: hypothetical protein HN871_09180, partial [Alphaproteobacteria bacterium]|nr:hypothetical protein [Alphaproteobacteria bacterium]
MDDQTPQKAETSTRVFKYGLIPMGYLSDETITHLRRANWLWNKLVEIHRKNSEDIKEARCAAHLSVTFQFIESQH